MRLWIVKYGEVVPFGPERAGGQLFRAGSVARALAQRGHDVTWWTGRFEHQTKRFIAPKDVDVLKDPESELKVRLIDSPGYASNMSFSRVVDHALFRRRLRVEMRKAPAPDLILVSFPIPEIAMDCIAFGKQQNIPVVVDVRDLWPDVIVGRLRDKLGFFPEFLAAPYRRRVAKLFQWSDAVYATSEGYLKWAQNLSQRSQQACKADKVFLLASEKPPASEGFSDAQRTFWQEKGVDFSKTVFCWVGSLSSQRTHENMLDAFEQLPADVADRVQLVVCGGGDLENRIKQLAQRYPHIVYGGFVPNQNVKGLCLHADVGLFCYDNVQSFQLNYTNKFGEYLGCGLPVLTTVTGPLVEGVAAKVVIQTGGSEATHISQAITKLAHAPPSEEMKVAARRVHSEHFHAPVVYEKFCESLESVIEAF